MKEKFKDLTIEEKEERLQRLNELINKYAKENNLKYLNKETKVLLEEPSKKEGFLSGYTDTMKLVNVKASKEYLGKIVKVKIFVSFNNFIYFGKWQIRPVFIF